MQFVRYNGGSGATMGIKTGSQIHSLADLPEGDPSFETLTNQRSLDQLRAETDNGSLHGSTRTTWTCSHPFAATGRSSVPD